MVADLVAAVDDGPDGVGVALGGEAGHEERGAHVLACQQSQRAWAPPPGARRTGGVISDIRAAELGSCASTQDSASTSKVKAAAAR